MHGRDHTQEQERAPLARALRRSPSRSVVSPPAPEAIEAVTENPEPASSRYKRPQPHPTRSGTVRCLACGVPFVSWDRTCNRLCSSCAKRK
jgi:hypothetical protein